MMQKVNTNHMAEYTWSSPKGKFGGAGKEISEELGRKPDSMDRRLTPITRIARNGSFTT